MNRKKNRRREKNIDASHKVEEGRKEKREKRAARCCSPFFLFFARSTSHAEPRAAFCRPKGKRKKLSPRQRQAAQLRLLILLPPLLLLSRCFPLATVWRRRSRAFYCESTPSAAWSASRRPPSTPSRERRSKKESLECPLLAAPFCIQGAPIVAIETKEHLSLFRRYLLASCPSPLSAQPVNAFSATCSSSGRREGVKANAV